MEEQDCDLLSLLESCDRYSRLQIELAQLISDGCFHLSKARKSPFTSTTSVDDVRFEIDPIIRESNSNDLGTSIHNSEKTIQIQGASDLVDELISRGVRVVAFDMDQCMVAKHSLGSLRNTDNDIHDYVSKTTNDFIVTAKIMHERGLLLAVATHSDEAEHGILRPVGEYILGESLVQKVLAYSVPELISNFKVVAYNPSSRNNTDPTRTGKKHHIKEIADFYSVSTSEVILFDDDRRNISDTDDLYRAIQVCENLGFRVLSALHGLRRSEGTTGGVILGEIARKAELSSEASIEQDTTTTPRTTSSTSTSSTTTSTEHIAAAENPLFLFAPLPPPALRSAKAKFDHALQLILQGMEDVRNIHDMQKRFDAGTG